MNSAYRSAYSDVGPATVLAGDANDDIVVAVTIEVTGRDRSSEFLADVDGAFNAVSALRYIFVAFRSDTVL